MDSDADFKLEYSSVKVDDIVNFQAGMKKDLFSVDCWPFLHQYAVQMYREKRE